MENNFNRVEKKYCLNYEQFKSIRSAILPYVKPDKFCNTHITSIYLDNENFDMINRSIEKPRYKEKIRIREYRSIKQNDSSNNHNSEDKPVMTDTSDINNSAASNIENPVFVEIKKKYKGIVYKRRIAMSLPAAKMFLQNNDYCSAIEKYPTKNEKLNSEAENKENLQIAHEIYALMQRHDWPKPAMAVINDRLSYKGLASFTSACDEQSTPVRITFDHNMKYLNFKNWKTDNTWDFDLESKQEFQTLIDRDLYIMEIKFYWGMPLWLTEILDKNHVYMQSFSKVGNALKIENDYTII